VLFGILSAALSSHSCVVGNVRIPPESSAKARITRIGSNLLLLSVPVESALDPSAARMLTTAERAVVELTLDGLSNAAVARKRRCSPRTVANQLAAAYKKLGVGSRRELRAKFGR
jgi:DNA-binding CsgD family transcriptional regulator